MQQSPWDKGHQAGPGHPSAMRGQKKREANWYWPQDIR
jgi:hypothetical protein